MKTSSTNGWPLRAVILSDTWATPVDVAARTAELVSITGVAGGRVGAARVAEERRGEHARPERVYLWAGKWSPREGEKGAGGGAGRGVLWRGRAATPPIAFLDWQMQHRRKGRRADPVN